MIVTFPKLNPIIFQSEQHSVFEQANEVFMQKWNKIDYIVFQVSYDKPSFGGGIIAKLVDNNGLVISDFMNDIVSTPELFQGILRVSCNVPDGIYRVLLTTPDNKFAFYSNFFQIGEHENTMLINYSCSRNKFDSIFRTPEYAYSFNLRVDGGIKTSDISYNSDDVFYSSQARTTYLLDAIPYTVRKYTFGNSLGMPNWMAEKINRIFGCDDIKIDNVSVVKNDGAKLEAIVADAYPYVGLKIELLHQKEGNSDELYNGGDVMQSGFNLELVDKENSHSENPPKTGRIHIGTFEKTYN